MADNLYDVLSGIQVTADDITQATTFAKQYLQALSPDLDLREGIALGDTVLRPNATFLAMVKKGLDYYFANNTVSGITDTSDSSMVDKILSNFFIERNLGGKVTVNTRLYFLLGNRDIFISASNSFSMDNVVVFQPVQDVYIFSTDLTYDSARDEFYYDLLLTSTSNTASANNITGDFLYHSQVDPYFLSATVLYVAAQGTDPETNTQFIERSKSSLSTRNLINNPSIKYIVGSNYAFTQVVPKGYGDVEMIRDTVQVVNPITHSTTYADTIHTGGMVDVYVNDVTLSTTISYTTDTSGDIFIPALYVSNSRGVVYQTLKANTDTDSVPYAATMNVTYGSGTDPVGTDFVSINTIVPNLFTDPVINDVGFSYLQCVKVNFPGYALANFTGSISGTTLTVSGLTGNIVVNTAITGSGVAANTIVTGGTYPTFTVNNSQTISSTAMVGTNTATLILNYFPNLYTLQQLLDNNDNKVLCANYLARSLNNYAIDVNITHIGSVVLTAAELTAATTALKNYFSTLLAGQSLIVSNLIQVLLDQAKIPNLDVGITVTYTLFDRYFTNITGTITSYKTCNPTEIFVLRNVTSD